MTARQTAQEITDEVFDLQSTSVLTEDDEERLKDKIEAAILGAQEIDHMAKTFVRLDLVNSMVAHVKPSRVSAVVETSPNGCDVYLRGKTDRLAVAMSAEEVLRVIGD